MKLPGADHAIVSSSKILRSLLEVDHPEGGSKAKLFRSLGYTMDDWQRLELDLRAQHLEAEVVETRLTQWGMQYAIVAPFNGPWGDTILMRSVWQIDLGTDAPRLITMYPE